MADLTIKSSEEMVGSGHATKTDTLNRLALVAHETSGVHKANHLDGLTLTGTITLPTTTTVGDVSSTELQYVNGVTSAIQTQLNAKAPSASPIFTGTTTADAVTLASGTISTTPAATDNTTKIANMSAVQSAILNAALADSVPVIPADAGKFLTNNGTDISWGNPNQPYIYIRDEKTASSAGGTFTAGAWRTRTLNTEVIDTGGNATLASNQITLLAGTYRFRAQAPANQVDRHRLRLFDITGNTELAIGSSHNITSAVVHNDFATVSGRFTLTVDSALELQHYCSTTASGNGFGLAANLDSKAEVYAEIELWREL